MGEPIGQRSRFSRRRLFVAGAVGAAAAGAAVAEAGSPQQALDKGAGVVSAVATSGLDRIAAAAEAGKKAAEKVLANAEQSFQSPVFEKPIRQNPDGSWSVIEEPGVVQIKLVPIIHPNTGKEISTRLYSHPNELKKDGSEEIRPLPHQSFPAIRIAGAPYWYNPEINPQKKNLGNIAVTHDGRTYTVGLWFKVLKPTGDEKKPGEPQFAIGREVNVIPTPPTPQNSRK